MHPPIRTHNFCGRLPRRLTTHVVTLAVIALASGAAWAQPKKNLGAYVGIINVSGSEISPKVNYRATIKVNLPLTEKDGSAATADYLADEPPVATVTFTHFESSHKEKFADSGGQFNSWECKLPAPVELQMKPTGILNIDLAKKKHAFSLTFLTAPDAISLNCTHSRSGPYKKKQGLVLYAGTDVPGMHYETQLGFKDAAQLTAKHTIMPNAQTKGQYGPIVQEWDLKLVR